MSDLVTKISLRHQHLGRHGGFHGDIIPVLPRLRIANPHAYPVYASRRRVPHVQPRRRRIPRGAATAAAEPSPPSPRENAG
ncbi:Os04g0608450 [Oryza sativa Japonica Group]|uniref:Os04g0608450 protein n=1 Tax=Oryza sativa subsp. japonica TaxID=39947 RepID=A0A0P0WEQ8_ORYSJ|nr:Os04g0608450 [Oryza sativa Japonica Group]